MVEEAEQFADEDKAQRERIESRNGLENYAFSLKTQVHDDDGLGGKLDDEDKETVRPSPPQQITPEQVLTVPDPRRRQGGPRVARGEQRHGYRRGLRRAEGEAVGRRVPHHVQDLRGGCGLWRGRGRRASQPRRAVISTRSSLVFNVTGVPFFFIDDVFIYQAGVKEQ